MLVAIAEIPGGGHQTSPRKRRLLHGAVTVPVFCYSAKRWIGRCGTGLIVGREWAPSNSSQDQKVRRWPSHRESQFGQLPPLARLRLLDSAV
jgi:hypothetical protein